MTCSHADPAGAPEKKLVEGFCPAEVGDLAVLETEIGDWVFGEVQAVTKAGRAVKMLTKHNKEIHVHTGDNIRIAKRSKLKSGQEAINAWLRGPDTFSTWQEAKDFLQPYKKEIDHGRRSS